MKRLLSIFLAIFFVTATVDTTSAVDASLTKKRLQRTETQIMRLISRSQKNPKRLATLNVRLSRVQGSLAKIHEQEQAHKPRLRLQPVKIKDQINAVVSVPSSTLEIGKASYYGPKLNGRRTASGEIFDDSLFTAAHRTLPFGTKVKVTNPANGNTVEVVITDRGPYVEGRVIDLTSAAFSTLDALSRGILDVQVEVIDLAK